MTKTVAELNFIHIKDRLAAPLRKPPIPVLVTYASGRFALCTSFLKYYLNTWGVSRCLLYFGYHDPEQYERLLTDISETFNVKHEKVQSYPAVDEILGQASLYEYSLGERSIAVLVYRQGSIEQMNAIPNCWKEHLKPMLYRMQTRPEFGIDDGSLALRVDNDEWLSSPSPKNALLRRRQLFHYMDLAPTSSASEHYWSIQPMVIQHGWRCKESGVLRHSCRFFFQHEGGRRHVYKHGRFAKYLLQYRRNCAPFDKLFRLPQEERQRKYNGLGHINKCYHLAFLHWDEKLSVYGERMRYRYGEEALAAVRTVSWEQLTVRDDFLKRHIEASVLEERIEAMHRIWHQNSS